MIHDFGRLITAADVARQIRKAKRWRDGYTGCCPVHDDENPSFAVWDTDFGIDVYCWALCPKAEILQALGLPARRTGIRKRPVQKLFSEVDRESVETRLAYVRSVYANSFAVAHGDAVSEYLENRGTYFDEISAALRLAENLPYYEDGKRIGYYPAMVAQVTDKNGGIIGIHRTYLSDHGTKADVRSEKKLFTVEPGAIQGSSVRLHPAGRVLAVCEGIETGLAISAIFGLPVWCALSASNLSCIWIPPSVEELFICADNDKSGVGQTAARECATKARAANRTLKVFNRTPITPGEDWADVNLRRRNHD